MSFLVLGSVLAFGGLLAAFGLFDNGNDDTDDTPPDPEDIPHGGPGADTLTTSDGAIEGWGGDDTITLTADAEGFGNQGNDTIHGENFAQAHGGRGNDSLIAFENATVWGDDGLDWVEMTTTIYQPAALPTGYGGAGSDFLSAFGGKAYGDDGDDLLRGDGFPDLAIYDGLGTSLYGGAGDDVIIGFTDAQLSGGLGDDTLDLANGSDGSGDAGDDLLILSPTSYDDLSDDGTVSATGGSGADIFALEMTPPNMFQSIAPTVITDYTPGKDRLLVEATVAGDYV